MSNKSPTKVRQKSNKSPTKVQQKSNRSPTKVQQTCNTSLTKVQQKSNKSPTKTQQKSNTRPKCVEMFRTYRVPTAYLPTVPTNSTYRVLTAYLPRHSHSNLLCSRPCNYHMLYLQPCCCLKRTGNDANHECANHECAE